MKNDREPPPELREFINSLAYSLDQILNGKGVEKDASMRKNGFVLMIYPFGSNDGRANIVTNGATHEEITAIFRTQLKLFERQQ